jgi:hypothetical protein
MQFAHVHGATPWSVVSPWILTITTATRAHRTHIYHHPRRKRKREGKKAKHEGDSTDTTLSNEKTTTKKMTIITPYAEISEHWYPLDP